MSAYLNTLWEEGSREELFRAVEKHWTREREIEAENARLRERLAEVEAHRKETGDALLQFTPNGSEYFVPDGDGFRVDPAACAAVIRHKLDKLHEARCEVSALRKRLSTVTDEDVERAYKTGFHNGHEMCRKHGDKWGAEYVNAKDDAWATYARTALESRRR
jgi:regulator of replication initiation timing